MGDGVENFPEIKMKRMWDIFAKTKKRRGS
jgi:hypothetical protein